MYPAAAASAASAAAVSILLQLIVPPLCLPAGGCRPRSAGQEATFALLLIVVCIMVCPYPYDVIRVWYLTYVEPRFRFGDKLTPIALIGRGTFSWTELHQVILHTRYQIPGIKYILYLLSFFSPYISQCTLFLLCCTTVHSIAVVLFIVRHPFKEHTAVP